MNRKSIIFVLVAGVVAAALVFDGVSHRRVKSSEQPVVQSAAATTQPADNAANSTAADQNPDPQGQATDAADANAADADAAQSSEGGAAIDDAQGQPDGDATAADATEPTAEAPQPAPPQPIFIPAGTTLAIRLGEDLGSRISTVNQRFSATLDRDIVVHGQTVIAAGAGVTGRVVGVKPAGAIAGDAKLELKITSLHLDSENLNVVTSTRSFGPTVKGKNKVGRFMKGLVKRAAGQEHEVLLAEQTACSFTLEKRLRIQ